MLARNSNVHFVLQSFLKFFISLYTLWLNKLMSPLCVLITTHLKQWKKNHSEAETSQDTAHLLQIYLV